MTFRSHAQASIAFAATHLEFILPYPRSESSLGIPSTESLELLRVSLAKAYPVTELPRFDDLLTAIDEADEKMGKSRANS